jgi:hypothetical protein
LSDKTITAKCRETVRCDETDRIVRHQQITGT